MEQPSIIFNRRLLRNRRDRCAAKFGEYDFLIRAASEQLVDRLDDMTRRFDTAITIGSHSGIVGQMLQQSPKIGHLIQTDLSPAMLTQACGPRVVCDEAWLPFADASVDLVISVWSLHWVNDLPGTLIQIRRMLKPDGLFLCIIPGAHTLLELRESLSHAESELTGGISPRVAPFVEVRDAGNLLQRAGFALPVVDSSMLQVTYPHALKLMHDLRGMGENNHLMQQRTATAPRALFAHTAAYYAQHFPAEDPARITASFELITLTGWAPHTSQQQPAKRGSGRVNLESFFDSNLN